MNCLKCGKETKENQVFCETCLASMEQYPVKPDAVIHLPHVYTQPEAKKQTVRRRALSPEEQLVQLKKLVRRLLWAVAALVVVLGLTVGMLLYNIFSAPEANAIGRNYTTMGSTAP